MPPFRTSAGRACIMAIPCGVRPMLTVHGHSPNLRPIHAHVQGLAIGRDLCCAQRRISANHSELLGPKVQLCKLALRAFIQNFAVFFFHQDINSAFNISAQAFATSLQDGVGGHRRVRLCVRHFGTMNHQVAALAWTRTPVMLALFWPTTHLGGSSSCSWPPEKRKHVGPQRPTTEHPASPWAPLVDASCAPSPPLHLHLPGQVAKEGRP